MNLLQQRKLAFDDARAELIKVGKKLPRLLQNVDKWEHAAEQTVLQGHIGQVALKLSLLKRPFRKVPAVEAWLAQYQHDLFRYRFLVLEGPSGLGKTQFSMSLSPRSLEVTCSNCEEPDLREFKSGTHDLVLLDESKCTLVSNCKIHASRTVLGESWRFRYEHLRIQSVAAQSQVHCQQQRVVGPARNL